MMSTKTAVIPGSYDPITIGHYKLILKANALFDKLYIALGSNTSKNAHFSLEEREEMLKSTFKSESGIEVIRFSKLTVDLCAELNATHIIRGLRNLTDFEYERSIEQMNYRLRPEITTLYFGSSAEDQAITSTIVREILKMGGDVRQFVPEQIHHFVHKAK